MGKPSKNGFTNTNRANHKIIRDSSTLCLSVSVFLSFLTCALLVPLEDKSKHLGQFVERVFIHAIHPPKAEPEGAPRFLRFANAQPISRLPLLLSATCGTAYDARRTTPLCRPYVPVLHRFEKGSKTWKLTAPIFSGLFTAHFLRSLQMVTASKNHGFKWFTVMVFPL